MNPPPPPAPPSSYAPLPPGDYQNSAAATAQAALSQQHVPTPSAQAAATANGRKRKASGVPGSRGVANLTPEQLAKKRANDREAQRAIRERTRNTIESLERRIKELESQQPYQDLQRVVQERDQALRECDELRRKLATVANLAAGAQQQQQQPNLHGMSDVFDDFLEPVWLTDDATELAALTAQQSPLLPLQQHGQVQQSPQGTGAQQPPQFEQQMLHPDLRSPHASSQAGASSHTGTPVTPYLSEQNSGRKWSPSMEQEGQAQYPPTNGIPYDNQRPAQGQMQGQTNGERLGVNFLLDKTQNSSTPPPGSRPQHRYSPQQRSHDHQQTWATALPINGPHSCPLDSLLGDFVANRRQQLAKGVPMHEVIGPEDPSFIALINPDPQRRAACHPISALLIDILSKFPDINATPEKVAVLYMMFLVLRWQICPCEACYARLPEWMRPIAEQIERPHPAWNDHLPWYVNLSPSNSALNTLATLTNAPHRPSMRRRLITGVQVNFEEFFIPFTSTLSLNWPYGNDHVLSPAPSDDPSAAVTMTTAFEAHIQELRHWSLGSRFRDTFPELVDPAEVGIRDVAGQ